MTLSNIGLKIVNLGSKTLMPGDSIPVTDIEASTPAVNALIKHGFLKLDESAAADDTPVKENPNDKKPESQTGQPAAEQPKEDSKDDKKAAKKTADK